MDSDDRVKNWLEEAESDLATAEILFSSKRYSACSFHAQQAAEKAMKALLFSLRQSAYGQSVWDLYLRAAGILKVEDPQVETAAKGLDFHYISARYPDALPSGSPSRFYDETIAKEALKWAAIVMSFVRAHVKS